MEKNSEHSSPVMACLEEESALARAGGYWNCLIAARKLATLLIAEGRSPWIARLRKTEAIGEHVFHAPLIPSVPGLSAAWTTHYLCCCDEITYDPVAGKPIRLEVYSREVFGEHIPMTVFIPAEGMTAYLTGPLLP